MKNNNVTDARARVSKHAIASWTSSSLCFSIYRKP